MKKPLHLLPALLAVLLLFPACRHDDVVAYDLDVVRASLNFPAKADVGEIEVSSSQPYTAFSDKEWCVASAEGNIVKVSVTRNEGHESRNATITLTSGTRSLKLPVSQIGSIWAIRGDDTYLTSDEDTTLIIPATLDFDYTVDMPEWMEGQEVEGGYQLHLLDNNTGGGREGTVTFTSSVGSKSISFRQFGTKSVCGSYTASYTDDTKTARTCNVTLETTDVKNQVLIKGLSPDFDIPLTLKSDGKLCVDGSQLVTYSRSTGYVFTVLHCTDDTDFTQQGYSYEAPLVLNRSGERLTPSFTFATSVINYKDMFEQDRSVTVDGFSLKTYSNPTVTSFFETGTKGVYTNIRLTKAVS